MNISQPNNFQYIYVMQDDCYVEYIKCVIYDGNKPYKVNCSVDNIEIKCELPNGIIVTTNPLSVENNIITFKITQEMTCMYGDVRTVINLIEGVTKKAVFPFIIKVTKNPNGIPIDDVVATSQAQKWADLSKSYAVGTNNVIRPNDEKDNSNYYYTQISKMINGSGYIVDDYLSETSVNPVENKVITAKLKELEIIIDELKKKIDGGDDNINSIFVGVGYGNFAVSEDGINWTVKEEKIFNQTINSVCCGNGMIIVCGNNCLLYSKDNGDSWTEGNIIFDNTDVSLCDIIYENNRFIAVGGEIKNGACSYYSDDGMNWTKGNSIPIPSDSIIFEQKPIMTTILYNEQEFIAGGSRVVWKSTDGINWTEMQGIDRNCMQHFGNGCHGNGISVLPCSSIDFDISNSKKLYYCTDGNTWNGISNLPNSLYYCVAYGNSKFVLGGRNGVIYNSTDGKNWSIVNKLESGFSVLDITFGNNIFILYTLDDNIYYSNDGVNWTKIEDMIISLRRIKYFGNNRQNSTPIPTPDTNTYIYSNYVTYNKAGTISGEETKLYLGDGTTDNKYGELYQGNYSTLDSTKEIYFKESNGSDFYLYYNVVNLSKCTIRMRSATNTHMIELTNMIANTCTIDGYEFRFFLNSDTDETTLSIILSTSNDKTEKWLDAYSYSIVSN